MNTIGESSKINTYSVSNENIVIVNSTKAEKQSGSDNIAAILSLSEEAFGDGVVMVKSSGVARAISSADIIATQNNLRILGFYSGVNTDYVNTEMRNSIRNFQKVYGMAETGSLTQNVYDKVREVTIKFNTIYNSNTLNTLALNSEFNLDATERKNFALIWTFLNKSMGLTGEQIVGVMANIREESRYSSDNLEGVESDHDIDYIYNSDDLKGYGILQWTNLKRKAGLLNVANSMGLEISDLNAQLAYFRKEMTTNFDGVYCVADWNVIKNMDDYLEVCDYFMEKIEIPNVFNYEVRRNYADIIYEIMNRGGFV